jgi:hypothetical protein
MVCVIAGQEAVQEENEAGSVIFLTLGFGLKWSSRMRVVH